MKPTKMLSKIVFVLGMVKLVLGVSIQPTSSGCTLTNNWGPKCVNPNLVPMTPDMQQAIVGIHNRLRNKLALGGVPPYKPAANMATMQWDENLAAKADLNVHQCEMKHDQCNSGRQNLATLFTTGPLDLRPPYISKMAGNQWFGEEKDGNVYGARNLINNFNEAKTRGPEVLHFTQFVWATANKLGCAASTDKRGASNYLYLACDYSNGNTFKTPVYEEGPPASNCTTSNNALQKLPGLCSPAETYPVTSIRPTYVPTNFKLKPFWNWLPFRNWSPFGNWSPYRIFRF